MPFGQCAQGALEACGIMSFEAGMIKFTNPFANTACGSMGIFGTSCGRSCAQLALAPGCVVPGRSLVALFINTAALLWFFVYLGYDLYDSWEVVCTSRNPGVPFYVRPFYWLYRGAPSPVHWLLLVFSIFGGLVVLLSFLHDVFTGPKPPPRSYYEAALWRGRRQVKVVSAVVLGVLFVGWGILISYFTFLGDDCSQSDPSLYNISLLLVLVFCCFLGLVVFLGVCVCLDCLMSGRARFILLISDPKQPAAPDPSEYTQAGSSAGNLDERLVPGVPQRDGYGTQGGSGAFLVGADDEEAGARICHEGQAGTWAAAGARLPTALGQQKTGGGLHRQATGNR